MENINWSEIYSNPIKAKEIGHEVISKVLKTNSVCTHNGVYHTDDVFATALLIIVCGEQELEVIRTREPQIDIFTFDVGGGEFDHHQCDEYRDGENKNSIFASLGKLWCTVGRTIDGLREEAWKEIDKEFVAPIDLTDNTGIMNPVNYFINSTRTNRIDDKAFEAAVEVAVSILNSIIQSGLKKSKELDEFEAEIEKSKSENSNVIELSRHYNVSKDAYIRYNIAWIMYPNRGCYNIQAVGKELLPENKRGLSANGDIVFTHKGGWLGSAKSKEAALKLLEE